MKEILANNFGIKLLSLLLASIMWIVIINLDDPTISRTYQGVTVEITNESAIASLGQVYDVVEGRTVTVSVKGKRSVVDKIKASDLKASVDLSNISSFNKVEITASCEKYAYENLEITAKPKLMEITLENRGEKQVNVKVVTTGTPANGYSVGMVEAKPVMLAVSGAESVVERIAEARVTVDVGGETETFTKKNLEPKLYDENGKEIDASRLTLNKTKVAATVNILKVKNIPIEVTTTGTPASGYGVQQIDYDPQTIQVAGLDNELSALASIPIQVDVEGAKSDVEQTILLEDYLPKGIRMVEAVESIAVKITIKQMSTKDFYLSTQDILVKNLSEEFEFNFISPDTSIRARLMGMKEALDDVTVANLGAYIDLEDLTEGKHTVEIYLTLGEEVQLVDTPKVAVKLTPFVEEEPEEETNTEDEGGESE